MPKSAAEANSPVVTRIDARGRQFAEQRGQCLRGVEDGPEGDQDLRALALAFPGPGGGRPSAGRAVGLRPQADPSLRCPPALKLQCFRAGVQVPAWRAPSHSPGSVPARDHRRRGPGQGGSHRRTVGQRGHGNAEHGADQRADEIIMLMDDQVGLPPGGGLQGLAHAEVHPQAREELGLRFQRRRASQQVHAASPRGLRHQDVRAGTGRQHGDVLARHHGGHGAGGQQRHLVPSLPQGAGEGKARKYVPDTRTT